MAVRSEHYCPNVPSMRSLSREGYERQKLDLAILLLLSCFAPSLSAMEALPALKPSPMPLQKPIDRRLQQPPFVEQGQGEASLLDEMDNDKVERLIKTLVHVKSFMRYDDILRKALPLEEHTFPSSPLVDPVNAIIEKECAFLAAVIQGSTDVVLCALANQEQEKLSDTALSNGLHLAILHGHDDLIVPLLAAQDNMELALGRLTKLFISADLLYRSDRLMWFATLHALIMPRVILNDATDSGLFMHNCLGLIALADYAKDQQKTAEPGKQEQGQVQRSLTRVIKEKLAIQPLTDKERAVFSPIRKLLSVDSSIADIMACALVGYVDTLLIKKTDMVERITKSVTRLLSYTSAPNVDRVKPLLHFLLQNIDSVSEDDWRALIQKGFPVRDFFDKNTLSKMRPHLSPACLEALIEGGLDLLLLKNDGLYTSEFIDILSLIDDPITHKSVESAKAILHTVLQEIPSQKMVKLKELYGNLDMAEICMQKGARLEVDAAGLTPAQQKILLCYEKENDPKKIAVLFCKPEDLLFKAAADGDVDTVRQLLAAHKFQTAFLTFALRLAAGQAHEKVVALFLGGEADPVPAYKAIRGILLQGRWKLHEQEDHLRILHAQYEHAQYERIARMLKPLKYHVMDSADPAVKRELLPLLMSDTGNLAKTMRPSLAGRIALLVEAHEKSTMSALEHAQKMKYHEVVPALTRMAYQQIPEYFRAACIVGNLQTMGALLQSGISNFDPLTIAIEVANTDAIQLVLLNAAESKKDFKTYPFEIALLKDKQDVFNFLMRCAETNDQLEKYAIDDAVLLTAIKVNNVPAIRILLQRGASREILRKNVRPAIYSQNDKSQRDLLKLYLELGLDIPENGVREDQRGNLVSTLFHEVTKNNDLEIATLLLKSKYPWQYGVLDKDNETALMIACRLGYTDLVLLFIGTLKDGSGISNTDKLGNTPLILACEANNPHIVSALLKAGANAYHKNNNKCDALMMAKLKRADACIKLLQAHCGIWRS